MRCGEKTDGVVWLGMNTDTGDSCTGCRLKDSQRARQRECMVMKRIEWVGANGAHT
jgi:hypothetical protein